MKHQPLLANEEEGLPGRLQDRRELNDAFDLEGLGRLRPLAIDLCLASRRLTGPEHAAMA